MAYLGSKAGSVIKICPDVAGSVVRSPEWQGVVLRYDEGIRNIMNVQRCELESLCPLTMCLTNGTCSGTYLPGGTV